jgi:hypothetical protein
MLHAEDLEPPSLSLAGISRLVKLQPRLLTHLCALKNTTTHSHTIALDEHNRLVERLKQEKNRLVECFSNEVCRQWRGGGVCQ